MGRNGSRLGMVERTGLYIAATLAVIFSILVVVFAMRGGGTSTATAQDPDREMPPDITDILGGDAGSGMYLELTDKDDPEVTFRCITIDGEEVYKLTLKRSQLQK